MTHVFNIRAFTGSRFRSGATKPAGAARRARPPPRVFTVSFSPPRATRGPTTSSPHGAATNVFVATRALGQFTMVLLQTGQCYIIRPIMPPRALSPASDMYAESGIGPHYAQGVPKHSPKRGVSSFLSRAATTPRFPMSSRADRREIDITS